MLDSRRIGKRCLKNMFFVFLMLFVSAASGQELTKEIVSSTELPMPTGFTVSEDPTVSNMVWNKWSTDNFSVLSIRADQGFYVVENIEKIKTHLMQRWNLPDVRFSAECRVLCVPDRETMKKLFRLDDSYSEVRRNENGNITLSVIWVILDGPPEDVVPAVLTPVCLEELASQNNVEFNHWVYRGMAKLNNPVSEIRVNLAALSEVDNLKGTDLFEINAEDWKKKSDKEKEIYDVECAGLCLLLVKEFGKDNFIRFIANQKPVSLYGFRSDEEFDSTFKRYIFYLSHDIMQNRTPEEYLLVE